MNDAETKSSVADQNNHAEKDDAVMTQNYINGDNKSEAYTEVNLD
jgi:hypothetical protein